MSKAPSGNLGARLLLAWAIPGAGHFLMGRRRVGGLLFFAITATFLFGLISSEGRAVSVRKHPYAFAAQVGAGLLTVVPAGYRLTLDLRPETVRPPDSDIPLYARLDLGLLFTMVAGLLNLVLVHNVYERSTRPASG